jgi:ubiquinone/menaquinone biosynthesis C-methylase UbiE
MSFTNIYKYIRYIDSKKASKEQYNIFILNFVKLHNSTEYLYKNIDKYTDILTIVYDFILSNLEYITIRVDNYGEFMNKYCKKITKALDLDTDICDSSNNKVLSNLYKFVDIGGGNGIFLNYLCKQFNTTLCTVIEKKNEEFIYDNLKNTNTKHLYWDNVNFDIADNTIDCCISSQVLHHLSDELIDTVVKEMYRCLKPNGIVFLVEHDANKNNKNNIDSDHHLYYILNEQVRKIKNKDIISIKDCIEDFTHYTKIHYINYKSEDDWSNIFTKHKFNIDTISMNKIQYNGKYYSIYRK